VPSADNTPTTQPWNYRRQQFVTFNDNDDAEYDHLQKKEEGRILIASHRNCERGPCGDAEIAHCRTFCHNHYDNSSRLTGSQHRMACHASGADAEQDDPCGRTPCHSFRTDTEKSSRRSLELVGAAPSDFHYNGQPTTKYN